MSIKQDRMAGRIHEILSVLLLRDVADPRLQDVTSHSGFTYVPRQSCTFSGTRGWNGASVYSASSRIW